jgi:hypothetical protein
MYLSQGQIAAFFFVPDSEAIDSPMSLSALFIDARTLAVQRRMSWPTSYKYGPAAPHYRAGLGTVGGEFLVNTGNSLLRYSADFRVLEELKLEPKTIVRASPSGGVLLISTFMRSGVFEETIVPANDLTVAKLFGTVPLPSDAVDNRGYVLRIDHFIKAANNYSAKARLCSKADRCSILFEGKVPFISFLDTGKFLLEEGNRFKVTEDARVIMRGDFPGDSLGGHLSVSQTGTRFSVQSGNISRHSWNEHVHIFDLASKEKIGHLSFKKMAAYVNGVDSGFGDLCSAISPDGQRLVVLRGTTLEAYDLPAEKGK